MNPENLKPKEYKNCDDLLIIDILRVEMYGLDLTNEINKKCEEQISSGTLYPILTRLEVKKYIKSRLDGLPDSRRRLFKATREGGQRVYDLKQIQEARENLNGDYGLVGA